MPAGTKTEQPRGGALNPWSGLVRQIPVLTAVVREHLVVTGGRGGVCGAERVTALLGCASRTEPGFTAAAVWLNAAPAARPEVAGEPAALSPAVADGRVTRVYLVCNRASCPAWRNQSR